MGYGTTKWLPSELRPHRSWTDVNVITAQGKRRGRVYNDSPIGRLFHMDATLQQVEVTNRLGESTRYSR